MIGSLRKIKDILRKYHCEIFMFLFFLYLGVYVLYYAYYADIYISPDSAEYLRETEAILKGHGYNFSGIAGYRDWFSKWPIGYPFLIAVVAFLTGRNVYLSSKILSVLIVAACFLVLYKKFKKAAWIYVFVFLNTGFLDNIYLFTWSEIPFFLAMLIFACALTEVIQRDAPEKRWFLLLGVGSVFAFLMRYFGGMTLMVSMSVTVCYLILYHFKRYHWPAMRIKIIGLIMTDIAVSLVISVYLILNKMMSGKMSGVDRLVFEDNPHRLIVELYDALVVEIYHATRMEMPFAIKDLEPNGKAVFVAICIGIIMWLFGRQIMKRLDHKAVFIFIGVFYYIVFIIVRFNSSMDTFGDRFFAPASMLISIGILGCVQERLERYQSGICMASSMILLFLIIVTCRDIGGCPRSDTAYSRFRRETEAALEAIPERSTIIMYDGDYRTKVIRPDIFYSPGLFEIDTVDDFFERYSGSEYICIRVKVVKILLDVALDQEDPLYAFLYDLVAQETDDEQYVIISVKNRSKVM